jgi:hypothetical protein
MLKVFFIKMFYMVAVTSAIFVLNQLLNPYKIEPSNLNFNDSFYIAQTVYNPYIQYESLSPAPTEYEKEKIWNDDEFYQRLYSQ